MVRANVVFGLVLLGSSMFASATIAGSRDFAFVARAYERIAEPEDWELAHAHLGVLGLANVALGLVLRPGRGGTRVASGCAIGGAVLVPAGFLLAPSWWRFEYLRGGGFLLLLVAVAVCLVQVVRAPRPPA